MQNEENGVVSVSGNVTIQYSAYDFLFNFTRNYASMLYTVYDTANYLSKVADFT